MMMHMPIKLKSFLKIDKRNSHSQKLRENVFKGKLYFGYEQHINIRWCISTKLFTFGSYQEDDLNRNRRKNNITSPIGCMNCAKELMGIDIKRKYWIKGGLQYIVYGKSAGYSVIEGEQL